MTANERTFQGQLFSVINHLLSTDDTIGFARITQEENVGTFGEARFADGKLYSRSDSGRVVSFELKNSSWDATDDALVLDAATKAWRNGYEYFVTGTPRQLVLYRTFQSGVQLLDRKLKIYPLSNARNDADILQPGFESEIAPKLLVFLRDLSDVLHGVQEIHWDSIDTFFVNKLSAYILESAAEMASPMHTRIAADPRFRQRLKNFLQDQDIFNVTLRFDQEDVYKISQLANYLLYLKIIFYSYLQREVPSLKLHVLKIPEEKDILNLVLQQRFGDVLKHDFELIFTPTVMDEFEFPARHLRVFKQNIEQVHQLDFRQLNAEIIGSIYNTLIDNQEQHDRGQHFTNTNEVDIVNAFCIKSTSNAVLDSGCGAGTFLVRAYQLLRYFQPDLTHQQLLERVWGIEIAPFPAFLAVMNLCLLDIKTKDNYPVVIREDFSDVESNFDYSGYFLNASKAFDVTNLAGRKSRVHIPSFDACVGNPPYIMQELIQDKEKWAKLLRSEFGIQGINQQSDLYVYYLMHTAAFLQEGGRLGYVISASWLDVSFGVELQKFLLDQFKIIAVIDHQRKRSFETASINTVIVILEKCSDKVSREENIVRFIRMFVPYENYIGASSDENRFERVLDFVSQIEHIDKDDKTDDWQIDTILQSELEKESTINGTYSNGRWGANYLRSSAVFEKIEASADNKLFPISDFLRVRYGVKTGANKFFYLIDQTSKALEFDDDTYELVFGVSKYKHELLWNTHGWYLSELDNKHYIIERKFVRQILKSQKEARGLNVDKASLKYCVLFLATDRGQLVTNKYEVVRYLQVGEDREYDIPSIQSVSGRTRWYDLTGSAHVGEFIFPSKIGETFRLLDNREANVYCDKVNYVLQLGESYREYADELFLMLNSIFFRYSVDLFARQLTGAQTLSDVDVNVVARTRIPSPIEFRKHLPNASGLAKILREREQGTIHSEIRAKDRRAVDNAIFLAIGLDISLVDDLYLAASTYVRERQEKSDSLKTSKSKQKLKYEDAVELVKERYPEVRTYKSLIKGVKVSKFLIPEGKGNYPKNGVGDRNLFGAYILAFSEGKSTEPLEFSSPEQFELFEFLNRTIGIKNQPLHLPVEPRDCTEVLEALRQDFQQSENQIKLFLKSNRSSGNPLSVYRDVLLSR